MIQVGRGTGSGFVIDGEGRILTNNHVITDTANGSRIRVVFSDGRRHNAVLVGRSPSYDLAVIKVNGAGSLSPLELGDSDQIQIGESVIAVGSPLGLPGTVTQGIISAQHRPVMVAEGADADSPTAYINAIQTDAPINPGNSGGPLVDAGRASDRDQLSDSDVCGKPQYRARLCDPDQPGRYDRRLVDQER